jgi:hypothetical protein
MFATSVIRSVLCLLNLDGTMALEFIGIRSGLYVCYLCSYTNIAVCQTVSCFSSKMTHKKVVRYSQQELNIF